MWGEMARIIHEVRPQYVFVENSPMLTSRGLGRVLGDLAAMGFDARWGVLGAADVGANHQRDRIWIVAKWRGQLSHAQHDRIGRWEQQQEGIEETTGSLANANGIASKVGGNDFANETTSGVWNNDHRRSRSNDWGKPDTEKNENLANSSLSGFTTRCEPTLRPEKSALEKQSWRGRNEFGSTQYWWEVEPNVGRVADGVAARVDRLKAIGNGQVPLCAATAWKLLSERI